MTEVLFYHLQGMTLESVLPSLIEKSIERGWKVAIQSGSEERADALDAQLWTYRNDSFLPHGTWRESNAGEQPVLITIDDRNSNQASVRFLIDGAGMPLDAETYARLVMIFDGADDEAVAAARANWTACKENGFDATYWQADEQGRWQRRT